MRPEGLVSITELARMRGISTDRIRHYDRIGLLKPAWRDPNSGVRYYSLAPGDDRLGTIVELRQLGMSLKDIKDYFDNRNLQKSFNLFQGKLEEIDQRIAELTAIRKDLEARIDSISAAMQGKFSFDQVRRKRIPKRTVLIAKTAHRDSLSLNREAIDLERILGKKALVVGTNMLGLLIDESADGAFEARSFIVTESQPAEEAEQAETLVLPAGTYACLYRRGEYLDVGRAMEAIRQYCADNGLVAVGSAAVETFEVDESVADKNNEVVYELQVLVRKSGGNGGS